MEEEAVCLELSEAEELMENVNSAKRDRECHEPDIEFEQEISPNKKQAKEVSYEDIRSEVTNPIVSSKENTSSFHDISSRNRTGCSEDTSDCSGNSSYAETLSDSSQMGDTSGAVSTSHVTLEIPKHLSSSGIRKITFKFSKRKDYYNETSYSVGGECMNLENVSRHGSLEWSSRYSSSPNLELKMSKKVVPGNYPTNVKKLLGTGILDGARVKYISISTERVLDGIIHAGGYLCGCSFCNFSNVLSAYEFEQHAGAKTRHPNNHIYFESGKPIYSIIQELKNAPLSILDEVIRDVAGTSINEESFQEWKASLQRSNGRIEAEKYNMKPPSLPNSLRLNSAMQRKRTADGGMKKRDNDLHRLLFMPNGLPDGAELTYFIKGQKLLEGYKQGNGIVCGCCERELSPSQFEAHAGMAARRQPYRHIYTSNGLTLHDIALSLANGQHVTTGFSDDMCAICGDAGDLLLCHECPQAFHPACLNLEHLPEGEWRCANCADEHASGRKAVFGELSSITRPIVIRLTRVVKAPEIQIGGCVICRDHDFSGSTFDDRTVILCDQCEKEFHVGCLRDSGLCHLKDSQGSPEFCFQWCADNSTLFSNIIRKKNLERELCIDGSEDCVEWRILSGKSRYPEHLPLLSSAAAIFRECFDPIVAKSGRDLIPVMVYGRNISGQEFGGMYCMVLMVRSVVVSAGLLRIFGREVAELPIVATSRKHQGKGYFQALFACIERLLSSLNVENLVLPAAEEALSIWTKKFGFTKMSEQQLSKYQKELQLTIFKGTSMLEKKVLQQIPE
ncbi:arginine biosynthesis bifunctional protein ArgJ [Hibiscus syriacus]|uniref:Arginine biosynthesis bifunctional protein ArgJ n=1 Tax=Hibiscus syriacus TaxID=106335 RepID=A0A6A3BW00_HIBSY|nr:arginine biosynthesis bifunctional protein ArgJ [Hibiscus syriacus]